MAENLVYWDSTRRSRALWSKKRRSRLLSWIRLAISFALIVGGVALVVNDRKTLIVVNWSLVPVAFSLMLISIAVKSARWPLLVRESRMDVSFQRLLGKYMVGSFFSTALPISVGGDAVRAEDAELFSRE